MKARGEHKVLAQFFSNLLLIESGPTDLEVLRLSNIFLTDSGVKTIWSSLASVMKWKGGRLTLDGGKIVWDAN